MEFCTDMPADRIEDIAARSDSTGRDAPIETQQAFWNQWNAMFLEHARATTSQRQAQVIDGWLARLGRRDLEILDVGCGSGWTCERLRPYGRVTGTDLSNEVLRIAQQKFPEVTFVAGDFTTLDLAQARWDVVVTLEVLAHVADQPAFVRRLAQRLKPGGHLMLSTQNRFVLERSDGVAPRAPGQIRQWVNLRELRALLAREFEIDELITVVPWGHRGILRLLNSTKLNRALSWVIPQPVLDRWKERAGLGHTAMVLARRR
jgi:2-polyprenyl-3-methyl-5-hydroxy-6-metoxy-1,4-benzoquinol methylase